MSLLYPSISGLLTGLHQNLPTAVAKGDIFVKLSLLWWGAGYVRYKQYVKAIIMTALEAGVILFSVLKSPGKPALPLKKRGLA